MHSIMVSLAKPSSKVSALQRVTDADIFKAVKRSIDKRGADKFTMSDVAREARLTRVQLYNRFGSKEGLVMSLLVDHAQAYKTEAMDVLLKAEDLIEAMVRSLLTALQRIERDPYTRMLLMPMVSGHNLVEGAPEQILELGKLQWQPVLQRGIKEGSLNPDMPLKEMAEWLTFSEITLLNARQTYLKTMDQCESMIRDFILPPILNNKE